MQLPKGQILIDKYLCALCHETGRFPVLLRFACCWIVDARMYMFIFPGPIQLNRPVAGAHVPFSGLRMLKFTSCPSLLYRMKHLECNITALLLPLPPHPPPSFSYLSYSQATGRV